MGFDAREGIVDRYFADWFMSIVNSMNKENVSKVVMVAWQIWGHRNGVLHGQKVLDHCATYVVCIIFMSVRKRNFC